MDSFLIVQSHICNPFTPQIKGKSQCSYKSHIALHASGMIYAHLSMQYYDIAHLSVHISN